MTDAALQPPVRAVPAEEAALRESAIVVDRSDRRRWRIHGPKAMDVLNGLVTNDVIRVAAGGGCYAAALTPKGKVIADLRIFSRVDDYIVETSAAAGPGWAGVLRKYVNPRLAKSEDITDGTADVAAAGANAAAAIGAVFGCAPDAISGLAPHAHIALPLEGTIGFVTRTPEIGEPAYDLFITADKRAPVVAALVEAGARPSSPATWDVRRIAAGWPAWGKDIDENTLAQEASLDSLNAISYDKGCYTGQETVARVHFRGHVNRYLRRARYSADLEIPAGADVFDGGGKLVGQVRSSGISLQDGGVAIAIVRREVPSAATLRAQWNETGADLELLSDS